MSKNIFFLVLFIFVQTMYGMDRPTEMGTMVSSDSLVFQLVFSNYLCDHKAICSFAATSLEHNRLMLDSAKQRKKMLPIPSEHNFGIIWHKYGTAHCYAYKRQDMEEELVLIKHSLNCNEDQGYAIKGQHFAGFIHPLSYQSEPFCNDEGILCFYGYGKHAFLHKNAFTYLYGIIQYCLNGAALRCVLNMEEYAIPFQECYAEGLNIFFEYPYLLKAILHSSQVKKNIRWSFSTHVEEQQVEFSPQVEERLEFWLKGVTIPDNYTVRNSMVHVPQSRSYESFDNISPYIKQAIEYRKQKQSKGDGVSIL